MNRIYVFWGRKVSRRATSDVLVAMNQRAGLVSEYALNEDGFADFGYTMCYELLKQIGREGTFVLDFSNVPGDIYRSSGSGLLYSTEKFTTEQKADFVSGFERALEELQETSIAQA